MTGDEFDMDLPFKEGSEIGTLFAVGDFAGFILSGARSLGLAILATAGAALTLF